MKDVRFDPSNRDECEAWIAEQLREDERRIRIREAGDAYVRTRHGDPDVDSDGKVWPTQEASAVLERVWSAHLKGDGLKLSHIETSVLWAETMRRTMSKPSLL